jgi:hypothetical protein
LIVALGVEVVQIQDAKQRLRDLMGSPHLAPEEFVRLDKHH